MSRPRLLDLFCGAGGAGMGYHLAGFDVVGVDVVAQPRYPFEFHQADALTFPLDGFDAVHASPPCQSESALRFVTGREYPDLLTPTLERLAADPRPWVVENVPTGKLSGSLRLCGSEFGLGAAGRVLRRHRFFGSNRFLYGAGGCSCAGRPVGGVYGHGGGKQQARGFMFGAADRRAAMGIDWMRRDELSEAIPPAYTRFIGEQLLAYVGCPA